MLRQAQHERERCFMWFNLFRARYLMSAPQAFVINKINGSLPILTVA